MSVKSIKASDTQAFAITCVGVFLTGFTGLCFQNIWQRYLSVFFGNDALSISLVLSLFLGGLSLGYFLLGHLVKKSKSRKQSLLRYAGIEGLIGTLGILFPKFAEVLVHQEASAWLGFVSAGFFIFVASFLMGGTLPFLLHVWSVHKSNWRRQHMLIYGFNSLGAFLGSLTAGLYLLEYFGLNHLSYLCGAINGMAAALLAIYAKRLKEERIEPEFSEHLQVLSPGMASALSFFSGGLFLVLENILIRSFKLAFGGHYFIFPLAVGVFTGAIALGVLFLRDEQISLRNLKRHLWISLGLLTVVYVSIPYWPLWAMAARSAIGRSDFSYNAYRIFAGLLFALVVGPAFLFLGRLLPQIFLLTSMNAKNYFIRCGQVYGANAAGAIFGGILGGHLLLTTMNLDSVFKTALVLILIAVGLVELFSGATVRRKMLWSATLLALLVLPSWNRNAHLRGMATASAAGPTSVENLWSLPGMLSAEKVEYLRDGPSGTVSVVSFVDSSLPADENIKARSFTIDGKPDGNTYSDYSTMYLLGALPYMLAPKDKEIKAAVVGLGTGITGGVLAHSQDVSQVDVMEISKEVIEASEIFKKENFNMNGNSKVRILHGDALSILRQAAPATYDIILSEPSNPWVVGMENLFSEGTYAIIRQRLGSEGVFVQWIHSYSMSLVSFHMVLKNLKQEFPQVNIFTLGHGDLALVATLQPLKKQYLQRRFAEAFYQMSGKEIGWTYAEQIELGEVLTSDGLNWGHRFENIPEHSLHKPALAFRGSREKFYGESFKVEQLLPADVARRFNYSEAKEKAFQFLQNNAASAVQCKTGRASMTDFCQRGMALQQVEKVLQNSSIAKDKRLEAYSILRSEGVLAIQNDFLNQLEKDIASGAVASFPLGPKLIQERVRDGQLDKAESTLNTWIQSGRLSAAQTEPLKAWMRSRGTQIQSLWTAQ